MNLMRKRSLCLHLEKDELNHYTNYFMERNLFKDFIVKTTDCLMESLIIYEKSNHLTENIEQDEKTFQRIMAKWNSLNQTIEAIRRQKNVALKNLSNQDIQRVYTELKDMSEWVHELSDDIRKDADDVTRTGLEKNEAQTFLTQVGGNLKTIETEIPNLEKALQAELQDRNMIPRNNAIQTSANWRNEQARNRAVS